MVGVDEVGRGCLAGPLLVVAARQVLDLPEGLKDSKLLSRKQRIEILNMLSICCNFGEGWVACREIDSLGLAKAMKLGVARALRNLEVELDEEIIMDGSINYLPKKYINVDCVIDADANIPLVSAASIYAKVKRDEYMSKLKERYPNYGFENHVGYGTAKHLLAIKSYGAINGVHRLTFKPLTSL